jgi:8-oxo-dGTP pyrophosphatase MutT (NUDIX family)
MRARGSIAVSRRHGAWTIKERVLKYENEFIEVNEDRVVQPDGQPGHYATVKMKAGVSVLAIDADGFACLTSQFRYAVGKESIEVVSGAMDEDEEPEAAARRELREELGIDAAELISLGRIDIDTSIVNCPAHQFLARDLSFKETKQEDTENISLKKMRLDEAVSKVMKSEITHGPTCVLILKASDYLKMQVKG